MKREEKKDSNWDLTGAVEEITLFSQGDDSYCGLSAMNKVQARKVRKNPPKKTLVFVVFTKEMRSLSSEAIFAPGGCFTASAIADFRTQGEEENEVKVAVKCLLKIKATFVSDKTLERRYCSLTFFSF